jgi:hypothetical protein
MVDNAALEGIPLSGLEELVVYKAPERMDLSDSLPVLHSLIGRNFSILEPNVNFDGILSGIWHSYNPGYAGLILKKDNQGNIYQFSCRTYAKNEERKKVNAHHSSLYFSVSLVGNHDFLFSERIKQIIKENKAISHIHAPGEVGNIDYFYDESGKFRNKLERHDFSTLLFLDDLNLLSDQEKFKSLITQILDTCKFPSKGISLSEKENLMMIFGNSQCILYKCKGVPNASLYLYVEGPRVNGFAREIGDCVHLIPKSSRQFQVIGDLDYVLANQKRHGK